MSPKAKAKRDELLHPSHRRYFELGYLAHAEEAQVLVEALEKIVGGLSEKGPRVLAAEALAKYKGRAE